MQIPHCPSKKECCGLFSAPLSILVSKQLLKCTESCSHCLQSGISFFMRLCYQYRPTAPVNKYFLDHAVTKLEGTERCILLWQFVRRAKQKHVCLFLYETCPPWGTVWGFCPPWGTVWEFGPHNRAQYGIYTCLYMVLLQWRRSRRTVTEGTYSCEHLCIYGHLRHVCVWILSKQNEYMSQCLSLAVLAWGYSTQQMLGWKGLGMRLV